MTSFADTKTGGSRTLLVDSLTDRVQEAVVASIASGVVLPYLLEGVNVDFLAGAFNRSVHANVTLDPLIWDRDKLPLRGNRPRVDSGSQWFWYDLMEDNQNYAAEPGSPERTQSFEKMKQILQDKVTDLLVDIATVRLHATIADQVKKKSKGLKR